MTFICCMFLARFFWQRQCYQAGKTRTNHASGYDFNTFHHPNHNTQSQRASVDITKHVTYNRKDKGGSSNTCLKDQSYQTKNKGKGNKQKVQKNKKNKKKNQEERGRSACRGRGHQTRFMSKGGDRKHNNRVSKTLRTDVAHRQPDCCDSLNEKKNMLFGPAAIQIYSTQSLSSKASYCKGLSSSNLSATLANKPLQNAPENF